MPLSRPVRPNGPGEPSPGLRPQADALGQQAPQAGGLKGRERLICEAVPTLRKISRGLSGRHD